MSTSRGFLVQCLALALFGHAQMLRAESPPSPPTAQQIYNEAQTAFDNADWPSAINGLVLLAKPDEGGRMSHSQGVIHARLAQAYAHEFRIDKATDEATLALKGLGPSDDMEFALTWLAIGDAQRVELAMTRAIDSFQKGLDSAREGKSAELVVRAEVGLALCDMTLDPAKATQLLDAVLAAPETAATSNLYRAQIYDLRGRATLNLGRPQEAMPFLSEALELSGGIQGTQVSLVQIGIRGDAAIGALLTNHSDDARKYLTWTGAGHLQSEEWTHGLGDPPVCSEAADIHPNDMAVIEFTIGANGRVTGAAPVYVSRPGMLGIAFAQAVREWSWNPERIAKLPSFWRNMVRIELRCITHPNPRGLTDPFRRETVDWLRQSGLSVEEIAPLTGAYVSGDDVRLGHEDLAAVPALYARLRYETNHGRLETTGQHLAAALNKLQAPMEARALAVSLQPVDAAHSSWSAANVRMKAEQLATFQHTDPKSAATAWLTLEYAIALEANGRFDQARPVLERVLAYPTDVLDEHDPVREVAILHISALQRHAGDAAGANTQVNAAGLTRAQCMLFDVRPVATDRSVSMTDFPNEALRWGFDGFAREAFDIDAEGRVQNARTIVAYPPFVFSTAAEKTVARFRYLAPVVDGGAAGCDSHSLNLNYNVVH